jgi:hypothetical protein
MVTDNWPPYTASERLEATCTPLSGVMIVGQLTVAVPMKPGPAETVPDTLTAYVGAVGKGCCACAAAIAAKITAVAMVVMGFIGFSSSG